MNQQELESFKAQIKGEGIKILIKTARDMRKILGALDAEITSRKGPSK